MSCVKKDSIQQITNEELMNLYIKNKDNTLKQELVLRYIYLVRVVAMQMRGIYLGFTDIEDMVNELIIVLMNSIDKFEPDRNVKFESYISMRIRGAVIDIARKQDWVPRTVKSKAKEIEQAISILLNKLSRYPTDIEVAQYLNISLDKYLNILSKTNLNSVLSLDELIESSHQTDYNMSSSSKEVIDGKPEETLQKKELSKVILKAIEQLNENEQQIISLYYQKEMKMKEIATILSVTESRVSQIHSKTIMKLKAYISKYLYE